jgi:GWxTD domain-containing protein
MLFNSKKSIYRFALAIGIIAIFLTNCNVPQKAIQNSDSMSYDTEEFVFYPNISVYHHSDDSSQFFIDVFSSDLLYARASANDNFSANVDVHYKIYRLENETQKLIDSSAVQFTDVRLSGEKTPVQFKSKFSLKEGLYSMSITLKDLRRGSAFTQTLQVDKRTKTSRQNYLLFRNSSTVALTVNSVLKGDTILVVSDRNAGSALRFYKYLPDIKLPPAPFSSNYPDIPSFKDFVKIQSDSTRKNSIVVEQGLYFVSANEAGTEGYSFFTVSGGYPTVRKIDQLHYPVRYLTTKAEFDDISKNKYPKEKLDQFWIETAGTKDRARILISTFYHRVEEANTFFSTYTEGWRTDRGMMHVVFGSPTKINRTKNSETWIYGEEDSNASLQFHFEKIESPWTDNLYVLNRDPLFKSHWESRVSSWRNGRIYNN